MRKIVVLLAVIVVVACKKESTSVVAKSVADETKSHKAGEACQSCHKTGGSGEGIWTMAGTAYSNIAGTTILKNAIVKLTTEVNDGGVVKYTLTGDANGNFYTAENIDFTTPLYVSVANSAGSVAYMNMPISHGNCNMCHSSSMPIVVE